MNELPTLNSKKPEPKSPIHQNLDSVRHIVAVSSGKGGVGKSTVSVNLAISLAKLGFKVGLMDADVYGPSVPKMLDGYHQPSEKNGKMVPIEKYGVKFMSMALLTNENSPVIWRGPMATKLIQTFLMQVAWGELDYLLIDLPPGTGDVQLTLTQSVPLRGAVVVTTPQEVAVGIAMRGIRMFDEVKVPILGVIENMSGFICSHCGEETPIFRQGGAEKITREDALTFLGRIPLDPQIAVAGDVGTPITQSMEKSEDQSDSAQAIHQIAGRLIQKVDEVEKLTDETVMAVAEVAEKEGKVWLRWSDGTEANIKSRELRFNCGCATCVDENTGKRLIEMKDIPEDIYPKGFRTVGRYGIQISWSDGHSTGIYTYNRLRELCS